MDKNFTPEQIDMINRIVFAHLDQMKQKTAEIVEETERAAHQQLQDSGIDITDFSPANQSFLMVTLIQNLIDRVHGGDMAVAQQLITMEAKRLNISVNVEADQSRS
ncbi:nitroreductase [Leclercia sp. CFBP8987]|uniref:nitroreductase n=1 Tax=Leclercia sp. CFBP8987 TaxID=3096525 RepID=UPI002A6A6E73|nr:nitroreductase [Leclercia sp. CFBP8987]MDY0920246.1 nitroreductase [Leclercia sp. CFBP8987]